MVYEFIYNRFELNLRCSDFSWCVDGFLGSQEPRSTNAKRKRLTMGCCSGSLTMNHNACTPHRVFWCLCSGDRGVLFLGCASVWPVVVTSLWFSPVISFLITLCLLPWMHMTFQSYFKVPLHMSSSKSWEQGHTSLFQYILYFCLWWMYFFALSQLEYRSACHLY